MEVAAAGCVASLAAYDNRSALPVPSGPRDRGTSFHRIVEGIQTGLLAGLQKDGGVVDTDAIVKEALQQGLATAEVESLVLTWIEDGWAIVDATTKLEWSLGATEAWNPCAFDDARRARYRGIIDRADILEEVDDATGESQWVIVITDWKSGWSGFGMVQRQTYVLLVDAWLSEHPELDAKITTIRVQKWSPVAIPRLRSEEFERREDVMSSLRREVEAAARVEDRLRIEIARVQAAGGTLPERPSARCVYCSRTGECETYQSLVVGGRWTPLGKDEESDRLAADQLAAMVEATKYAISDMSKHTRDVGVVKGHSVSWGWSEKTRRAPVSGQFWRDVLDREGRTYGQVNHSDEGVTLTLDSAALESLALRFAQVIPPSMRHIDKLARAWCPRKVAAQDKVKAPWISQITKAVFGIIKDEMEQVEDNESEDNG